VQLSGANKPALTMWCVGMTHSGVERMPGIMCVDEGRRANQWAECLRPSLSVPGLASSSIVVVGVGGGESLGAGWQESKYACAPRYPRRKNITRPTRFSVENLVVYTARVGSRVCASRHVVEPILSQYNSDGVSVK